AGSTSRPSCAGLTRASIALREKFLRRGWIAGSSPAMTQEARAAASSHLALAQIGDRVGRMPARRRADAVAGGVHVEKIGPAVRGRAFGARERGFELVRLLDHLALDAEGLGGLGVIDVGAAEIAGHVAAALELAAAVMPDAIALVVVAVIVEHDVDDRRLVARLRPQGLRAGEAEAAVADDRHH